jgi:hypothetical protein
MPQDWYLVTAQALQDLWLGFLYFIPNLFGALLVFLVGWFVASVVSTGVTAALNWLKLNQLFSKGQWDEALAKAGIKADVAGFLGQVTRWVLLLTFLSAAVDILGLKAFAGLFAAVVAWLPNVIVVVLVMVVTVVLADILEKMVAASVAKARIRSAHAAAMAVRWLIYLFALVAILMQLDIASLSPMVQTLFTGVIAMMVIAGGLAFGLGGKDVAKEILEDIYRKLKSE